LKIGANLTIGAMTVFYVSRTILYQINVVKRLIIT